MCEMEILQNRRTKICEKFAMKSPRYSTWFYLNDNSETQHNTRSYKRPLKAVNTRTQRYKNSTVPFLTELLNNYLSKKK